MIILSIIYENYCLILMLGIYQLILQLVHCTLYHGKILSVILKVLVEGGVSNFIQALVLISC